MDKISTERNNWFSLLEIWVGKLVPSFIIDERLKERLKAAEAKRIEKERTEKHQKLKGDAKDARSKYRENVMKGIIPVWYTCGWCVKYKLDATPEPSDEEEESSDEEDDGFGAKKKEVDEDPVARRILIIFSKFLNPIRHGAPDPSFNVWGGL